ncbi:MAG: SpoIIIAH-like family protein [Clostridia bacterium]|nr:SpoIIIAH-like family protein [Clostridia bacterium]MBR5422515.1 SpoIIIAH-like family protein [Clostridia bacterium]
MHVLIGKRQLLLAGLVIMLGLAVFVNWYYTTNGAPLSPEGAAEGSAQETGGARFTNTEEEADYFATVKLERETRLSAALEELEAVRTGAEEGGETSVDVLAKMTALTVAAKTENDIESLVTAQLGGNCVAVVNEDSVDVIVSRETLNETNVLVISDIVRSVVGDGVENVRVAAARG